MGGACGVVDGGGSLYFSAAGTRLLRTVELDTTGIRCGNVAHAPKAPYMYMYYQLSICIALLT